VSRALSLDDIADARAYERERDAFRTRVIDLKRRRRIVIGPIVALVFENRDTIRFQIQEMARAERLYSDEQIRAELSTYNSLIPEPGNLSATLFIELTSKDDLEEWLPKLVGIEQAVEIRLGATGSENGEGRVVQAVPEAAHASQLTRDDVTASVHYIHFSLTAPQVEAFAAGPVELAVNHPAYQHTMVLTDDSRGELLTDLLDDGL
jgi:hypothetical protein